MTTHSELAINAKRSPSGSTSNAMGMPGMGSASVMCGRWPASTAGSRLATNPARVIPVPRLTHSRRLGRDPVINTATAPAKGNITASVRVFNPDLQTTFVRQAELRQQTIGCEDQSRRWRQSAAILVRVTTSAFLRNARLGLWLIESRSSQ